MSEQGRPRGFQHGQGAGVESGIYECSDCGKSTRETGGCESGVGLCLDCYDAAGLENEHSDGYHDDKPHPDCPECKSEGEA